MSANRTIGSRLSTCRRRRAIPRVLFPVTLAVLASCVGPEMDVATVPSDLDGLPSDWRDGRVVSVDGHPGWTRGVFEVTADGAATYDVPLWAPPGRAGIEPNLSLHYSSRGGRARSASVGHSTASLRLHAAGRRDRSMAQTDWRPSTGTETRTVSMDSGLFPSTRRPSAGWTDCDLSRTARSRSRSSAARP